MDKHVMTKFKGSDTYLPVTFGDFAKRYDERLAYCGDEWFEKRFGMLIHATTLMEFDYPDEYMTESAMRKIPKMGPKRIKMILDNADYFGFTVLNMEAA